MQDHPLLSTFKARLLFILTWLASAIVWTIVVASNYPIQIVLAILDGFLFTALYAIISIGIYNAVKYSNLEKKTAFSIVVFHFGAAFFSMLIWLGVGYFIVQAFDKPNWDYESFFFQTIAWRAIVAIFLYSIVSLLYYFIFYYKNFRDTISREAELKAHVKEAELSMLRSQINPHFLFNSLNSISSLTITDPPSAQEMIIKLSEFLRYSMGESEKKLVSLTDELNYIQLYLDIEKVRFGSKLSYEWNVPELCREAKLPNMILQPLYENAVKYGVYESTGEVKIVTECKCFDGKLEIVISNNFEKESRNRKGKGVGISNIKSRLKLIYQRDDLFQAEKKDGLFRVKVIVPQNQ